MEHETPAPPAEPGSPGRDAHRTFEHDGALLEQVLRVYKPHCRYLTSTTVTAKGDPAREGGQVSVRGTFHIPESCYIDDTGHFNSVEFNLCFNQMIYFIMAKSIKERLIAAFDSWDMDDYWTRQLPDMFIVDFRSSFRRAMRGRNFWGQLDIVNVVQRDGGNGPLLILGTTCRYGEDESAACHGSIRLALKNPAPAGLSTP
ncbi:hypothetical protein E0L36_03260 [Streptomyces sp. AJS327]|uniref:FcoT family thioesterase n=1 Tax=Streptomyces sp. AJS327 TaxID=2545265 RepID=UPI00185072EC|nr:FcoT family thioesterase [Streptomyces sp. AJS327]MBA0049950.1 hypothetical protein [Streptomyces sp. AJS327]